MVQQIKIFAICRIDRHSSDQGLATITVAARCGRGQGSGADYSRSFSYVPILSWYFEADPVWRTSGAQHLSVCWVSWNHHDWKPDRQGFIFWLADVPSEFEANPGVL